MERIHLFGLLFGALVSTAGPAWGAADVTLSATFFSADAVCNQAIYNVTGSADFTTNDDGAGNDWLAVVFHDASGNYHDVDFTTVQVANDSFAANDGYNSPFTTFLASRPIFVRVHDIPDGSATIADTKAGLELASASPVLFELEIDPANDAGSCKGERFANWSLRIESLKNSGGQLVTGATALNLGGGATELTIAVPVDSMLIALYRAECSNDAASDAPYANVDILLDGVALPPTLGTSDAFCSANGIAGADQWVMARASVASAIDGPGVHSVQVIGSSVLGGNSGFGDSELIVMVPEPTAWQQRAAGLAALALLARRRARRPARGAAKIVLVAALAVLGSAAGAPKAGADTVLLNTSNAGNQAFAMSAGPSLLDLGSGTQFFFGVVRPTRLAILFAAECATNAAGTTVWVDLDILVDGVAVPESDDVDDAFCTSTSGGAPLPDEWVSVGHHVTIDLNFGHHFVEVRGRLSGGVPTDLWQIGDLSLSLIGQER